jgi:hypothetical protein
LVCSADNTTWAWEKVKLCNDAVAWDTFVGNATNKSEVWAPPAAPQITVDLPRMVYLPSVLAKFAVEKERMAFEMNKFLSELVANDTSDIEESQAKFLLQWFMAAGQREHGAAVTAQQKVALKLEVVVSALNQSLCTGHINNFAHMLGKGQSNPHNNNSNTHNRRKLMHT